MRNKVSKNKSISKGSKRYWDSEEGLKRRKTHSQKQKEHWSDPEVRARMSKVMKEHYSDPEYYQRWMESKPRGADNHNYTAFVVKAHLPNGDVDEVVFDGDTPTKDCLDFGIGVVIQAKIKQGKNHIITRRTSRTAHPWPKGTVITGKVLKRKK